MHFLNQDEHYFGSPTLAIRNLGVQTLLALDDSMTRQQRVKLGAKMLKKEGLLAMLVSFWADVFVPQQSRHSCKVLGVRIQKKGRAE